MADADTAELAEAAVGGGRRPARDRHPVLRPARRRADGPARRTAGAREAGMTTPRALELAAEVRARVAVPLVPMTYASPGDGLRRAPLLRRRRGRGRRRPDRARRPGRRGRASSRRPAPSTASTSCRCSRPTSADERIAIACARAGGFIYLVSVAGITGARAQTSDRVAGLIARVRPHTAAAAPRRLRDLDAGPCAARCSTRAPTASSSARAPSRSPRQGGAEALEAFVADVASALPSLELSANRDSLRSAHAHPGGRGRRAAREDRARSHGIERAHRRGRRSTARRGPRPRPRSAPTTRSCSTSSCPGSRASTSAAGCATTETPSRSSC